MNTLHLSRPNHMAFEARHSLVDLWERVLTLLAVWAEQQPQHHRLGRWTVA